VLIFVCLGLALVPVLNYFSARTYAASENQPDPELAMATLQQAISLAPWPSGRHHYSLAQRYLDKGDAKAALRAISRALQLDLHNARYYTLAADILLRLERPQAALALLLRSQELNPYRHPQIYTDLGDFYLLQEHDQPKALEWYRKGAEIFSTEALARYERYTPADRFQAFNLLLKLASTHEKLNQADAARRTREQAQQLLRAAGQDMYVTAGYPSPVAAVLAYWAQVPEHYRNPRHSFDSVLPGSQIQAPPPAQLDASRIQFFQAERDLFNATLIYGVPLKGQASSWLVFEDQLVGDETGWKIHARRNLSS